MDQSTIGKSLWKHTSADFSLMLSLLRGEEKSLLSNNKRMNLCTIPRRGISNY